jgi:hypothetical protein
MLGGNRMSKRWVVCLVLLFWIAVLAGCYAPPPEEQLWIAVHVAANSGGSFWAYGFLYDGDNLLSDAVITVEGTMVTTNQNSPTPITVTGNIDIIATQSKIGTITKSLAVPTQATGLTCAGGASTFTSWVLRTTDTLTLNWTAATNTDFYMIHVSAHDSGHIVLVTKYSTGNNHQWTGTSATLDKATSDSLLNFGVSYNHVAVQVQGYKWLTISEVSDTSVFEVGGVWSSELVPAPNLTPTPTPTP